MTTRGDTTVTDNRSAVWPEPRQLRVVTRVGRATDDDYLIQTVTAFAVDKLGNIYVADVNRPLREYDLAGSFVRVLARDGAGPGEVRAVTGIATLPDGGIAARDPGNGRISVYAADGRVRAQWPLPQLSGYGVNSLHATTSGMLLLAANPSHAKDGSPTVWPRPVYIRMSAAGEVIDTVWAPRRYTERCPVLSDRHFRSGWFEDIRWTYVPKITWALTATGELIIACPAAEAIDVIEATGHVTRARWHWPHVTASREERDYFKKIVALGQNYTEKNWTWTGPDLPSTKPPFLRIISAEDGRLWIWRSRPSKWGDRGWHEIPGGTFDVFERDGRYLGEVRVPPEVQYEGHPGTPDPQIRGDTVWAITQDTSDVEYVTRFVMSPEGRK